MSSIVTKTVPPFELEVVDVSTFSFGSPDKAESYQHEHVLSDAPHELTSRHAVLCRRNSLVIGSAVLGSDGGASGVHENSLLAFNGRCFVAVGPYIAALELPSLKLAWSVLVDDATCFGVHLTSDKNALISHGELQIARVSLGGAIAWTAGGADIFSEHFSIEQGIVRVTDFEHRTYRFDEKTGRTCD